MRDVLSGETKVVEKDYGDIDCGCGQRGCYVCHPENQYCTLCEESGHNIEDHIPVEMTPEYWEREKYEVTPYGIRDEYGGL